MSFFKCKMCGGTIEFAQGATVGECDSCGTRQTLPRLDDEKKANLYDRANHFRRNNDFDKAMSIYEHILNEDTTDAEAYWSLVLCRYGIEYVEDPASHRRVPTVNRTQFTSIFADEDFKSALQYADSSQKAVYEDEAKAIDEIQKEILDISQTEEPFDVFICYKETDHNGRRTPDSVLATELYHELTEEGFKVFFSRITLEDKLGTAYEPYIFAALNSAKVMVVLGTKQEYFNAVWVKNEWSRYLALIKNGARKMLIPAYRDMDPYDLPEEFSYLQAQDMSKLGFMQDLIHGIEKIVEADEPREDVRETDAVTPNRASIAALLKRVFFFLEDGKWKEADEYCERVLDQDPENGTAYLGKLMAELQVRTRSQLADCCVSFEDSDNYRKVMRFGDEGLKREMCGYIQPIQYNGAKKAMETAYTEEAYKVVAEAFAALPGYKDADSLAALCLEKAEVCRKDAVYATAVRVFDETHTWYGKKTDAASYEKAMELLRSIPGWKDADAQIEACQKKIEEIKALEESDRLEKEARRAAEEKAEKKRKKATAIVTSVFCGLIVMVILLPTVIVPIINYNKALFQYNKAESLYNDKEYSAAISAFAEVMEFKDSAERIVEILTNPEYLKNVGIGDYILFGSYEQDNDTSNGKEPIAWQVLAKEGTKKLVISKFALDCQPYNSSYGDVTWETCTLRTWLNGSFYNDAFDTAEKAKIATTTVGADPNPSYSTNPGSATEDNVFLLSIREVNKYFGSNEARKCAPTERARVYGASTSYSTTTAEGQAACFWWLRSPGMNQCTAACIYTEGSVNFMGDIANHAFDAVRPAMWIDLGE